MSKRLTDLIEHSFFQSYLDEDCAEEYEKESRKALSEFPHDFAEHYQRSVKYHDWFLSEMRWNRLIGEVSFTLLPPMCRPPRASGEEGVTLVLRGVSLFEVTPGEEAEPAMSALQTIYLMAFAFAERAGKAKRPRAYECVAKLFGGARLRVHFTGVTMRAGT